MIAESRDNMELPSELMNEMQKYMRTEFSPDVLANNMCRHSALTRIAIKAKDWCMTHGCEMPEEKYYECASQSLDRFVDNWRGKTPGYDDRGHRLGKPVI